MDYRHFSWTGFYLSTLSKISMTGGPAAQEPAGFSVVCKSPRAAAQGLCFIQLKLEP